ncbi:MAG: PilZ domain-containing protein [Bacteriovoracaceae bacterium]|nr:PilZ domain-containing protein [Bacteriovoracaceae bacterium]
MSDKVLDFNKKREENIEHKRRAFERIVFNNFLGAYATMDEGGGIYPLNLVDISHDGCMIQVPWNERTDSKFEEGEEIKFRMYFTKNSFIPVFIKVQYGQEYIEHGKTFMRYGCEFDQSTPSFKGLKSFIDFMYLFAEHSVVDRGDAKVFFV